MELEKQCDQLEVEAQSEEVRESQKYIRREAVVVVVVVAPVEAADGEVPKRRH